MTNDDVSSTSQALAFSNNASFVCVEDLPSSVYYVHISENSAFSLVAPPLNGSNYQSWSRAIRRALSLKNKVLFIDSSLPLPLMNDSLFIAWEKANNIIVSWLQAVVTPSIAKSVEWIEVVAYVWCDFKDRFGRGDFIRISDLQSDIIVLTQGDLSISDYYTSPKILSDKLDNMTSISNCACSSVCICGLDVVRGYRENDLTINFLRGLNDSFSDVRSQLLIVLAFCEEDLHTCIDSGTKMFLTCQASAS
ncbi:uncharacterized protein [Rutidosis leptorrhynchoides]|uniref:uncharacterized protein n=1 Tax=Rutidosis leptorrhynchoides TaxID=125765 RepID=UPI003A999E35